MYSFNEFTEEYLIIVSYQLPLPSPCDRTPPDSSKPLSSAPQCQAESGGVSGPGSQCPAQQGWPEQIIFTNIHANIYKEVYFILPPTHCDSQPD